MPQIQVLSQETIDKIAAGEVIERPMSVVKELLENAIDAKATAITVEIKDGGTSLIRITDNGCGIDKKQVPLAFLSHSTSKIKSVEDLMTVTSLGFRGEALSSIAAVCQVELITKTRDELMGTRYVIEGSKEKVLEDVGAPDGTTFLVRNIFYNTPARKKFLKTPQTEAGYISDLIERIALSHSDISFKFISNNQLKLQTSGNSNEKDIIYHIYGRDIASSLLEVNAKNELLSIHGYIGKPMVSRGNRNYENYFVNGRYIKSNLISKGIEDAYKLYLMQHQYPFTVLSFSIAGEELDVNVHPTKMELRFSNNESVYKFLLETIENALKQKELIPEVPLKSKDIPENTESMSDEQKRMDKKQDIPEPFERNRIQKIREQIKRDTPYEPRYDRPLFMNSGHSTETLQKVSENEKVYILPEEFVVSEAPAMKEVSAAIKAVEASVGPTEPVASKHLVQQELPFLSEAARPSYKIIGQAFKTYWIVEFENKLFIMDQHAAHEKVIFERTMKQFRNKEFTSQQLSPPMLLTLSMQEENAVKKYRDEFERLGYSIEHFGGKEYTIDAVPANLYNLNEKQYFLEMLDELGSESSIHDPEILYSKIATMSCKAAVKGNNNMSLPEFTELLDELMSLENPYNCPHGRPTIISMTRDELEKKFKRIV